MLGPEEREEGVVKTRLLLVVAVFAAACAWAVPAGAAPNGSGSITIDADVPVGGVALLEVRSGNGKDLVQSLIAEGDGELEVTVAAGNYRVVPRQVTVEGERFVGSSDPLVVRVKADQTSTVNVGYVRSLGVQNLQVTGIGETYVSVDWDVERGDETTVWRMDGDDAPTKPGQGTEVELTDESSFTDAGLEAGQVYTYSIFARPGDGAFGRDDVDPVSITVSTDDSDPTTPLFVLSPGTRILGSDDFTAYSGGSSLILVLADGVQTPTPGSVLAVPASEALPGGYLGEVVSVSPDGRTIELVTAPMASAFDLYHLEVPDISGLPNAGFSPGSPPEVPQDGPQPMAFTTATAAVPAKCSGSGSFKVTPNFSQSHDGHANITIDKWKIRFFPDVPHTVTYDVGYTTTLSATVDVESSGAATCGIDLPRFFKNVTYYPVPVALDVEPKAELSVFGKASVENVGGSVTAGFATDGKLSIKGTPHVDGDLTFNGNATEPKFIDEGGLNLLVDGSVTFGPGVGSKDIGVVSGVSGNFSPLDATASVLTVEKNGVEETCAKIDAKYKAGMAASLKAWVPGYSTDYSIAIDPLQGEWDWPGSPFHWPNDCTESDTPSDDVVGDGVTVIDDDVTGDDDQFGKVDGFVPGEKTWVLSTGRIGDVVGSPSTFASTDLGLPGDATLSQLSGFATYDAVAYQVKLVPNADTLVVRYAFASEEYPEYVGSSFNDVMAVFVDGSNCAFVPGTSTPVSINSINHELNTQYYVDNSTGASGYGTTMDGLTVPLECRVPVTPGEAVTVKVAVADASDGIFDSAIALLDGGIFSE